MSSLSVMECNVKTPLQWDWENLFMFNTTTTEVPRKLQTTEWEIDGDGGMDSLSVYSSGPGGYGGGSGSDLGHASLSKSSKSPSINSSSLEEGKGARFTLDAFEGITDNFSSKKENAKIEPTRTSTIGTSAGSGEPLLGLKLGKRTYFEDVCAATHTKSSSNSIIAPSSVTLAKRSKSSFQTSHVPRCQVEGCNLDLSSAKDYHRKHRVCENHSKSPKVVVGGLERRFCQQCSRFHGLAEFDEKKRSCRRRLSDHNARRRKPQTEAVHFNAARHSSSPYDGKQQMSFVWNTIPIFQARPSKNVAWDGTFDSKSTQLKGCNPSKVGNVNSQLQPPAGVEESAISTNVGGSQDLHRALSLLSTDSWGSCESKHGSLEYSVHANPSSISQPVMHAISQGFPHAFSGTWQSDQQSSQGHATLQGDGNNHFQEFQLLKAPFENGFYSNQMN